MVPEKLIVLLFVALGNASFADADVVDVTDAGPIDLAPFVCTDITRSTMISRACYDETRRFAVLEVRSTYRQFCDMPKATFEALLDAPSMGQFYNKRIDGKASGYPFPCAGGAAATR